MSHKSLILATFTLGALAFPALAQQRAGQPRADHPHLRAALHEIRDARQELANSVETWPQGHKERAMTALGDGMDSLKSLLDVKDVGDFRGVDRTPDYYKKFKDYPKLRAALGDLREARDELKEAPSNFNGMKERAMEDIDVAVGEIVTLMKTNNRGPRPK